MCFTYMYACPGIPTIIPTNSTGRLRVGLLEVELDGCEPMYECWGPTLDLSPLKEPDLFTTEPFLRSLFCVLFDRILLLFSSFKNYF